MKSITKDNTEGKMHQMKGEFRETILKITWNGNLEAEGKSRNLDGKGQEEPGQIEKVTGDQRGSFYT